jgi:hypothetical protein
MRAVWWLVSVVTLGGCEAILGGFPDDPRLDGSTAASGGSTASAGGATSSGGSTSVAGGSGGVGGQPPGDCWGEATDWASSVIDRSRLAGENPRDLTLSRDGLALHYHAQIGAGYPRPYEATRPDRSADFSGGVELAAWPALDAATGNVSVFGDEMVIRVDTDPMGALDWQLAIATRADNGVWSFPAVMPGSSDPEKREAWPRTAADGTILFFQRQTDTTREVLGMPFVVSQLFQATRAPNSAKGTPFGGSALMPIAGVPDDDFVLCLAPSWDGLRLFIGTTVGQPLTTPAEFDKAIRVFFTQRATPADTWDPVVLVPELTSPVEWNCPVGITDDGCQIVIQRTNGPNGESSVLATRAPS